MKRAIPAAIALMLVCACTSTHHKAAAPLPEVELRVGVVFTSSGQGGDLASAVLGAIKLATDDVATRNVKAEITQVDYAGDVHRLQQQLEKLSGVDAVIVGTDDLAALPALDSIQTIPVLHTLMTADIALAAPNAYRIAPSDKIEAQRIARFLVQHRGYRKISMIADTTTFGQEGRSDMEEALQRVGSSLNGVYQFAPGSQIHTVVSQAAGSDACIVWVQSDADASRIVVDEQHSKFSYQLVLSGNLATASFAKNATAQVTPVAFRDGMLSVGPWAGPWFRLQRIISFYQAFKDANSELAPVQAASVYDALEALASVARSNGTSASSLKAGLESLKSFEGAGVPISFAPDNHEGYDLSDLAMYGFTKDQTAPGGDFEPEVDTGGGFFTVINDSLELPSRYSFLENHA
ncbi:MAG: ABC transporter substrate-binding protein [Actinomycetota bacterium]